MLALTSTGFIVELVVVLAPHMWIGLALTLAFLFVEVVVIRTVIWLTDALTGVWVVSVVVLACCYVLTFTVASMVIEIAIFVALFNRLAFASTGGFIEVLVV